MVVTKVYCTYNLYSRSHLISIDTVHLHINESGHLRSINKKKIRWSNLATNLERCHQGDTACLAKVINTYVHTLKDGRRDINIVPLDPLHVDEVDIIQGNSSPVNINLNFKDVQFYGLSNLNVKKVM